MKSKKRKVIVANEIMIVDDEGNPKIGMKASGPSGYAGISFYKGKGRERYQALHIYIVDREGHSVIEFWPEPYKEGVSLGASLVGAGMSVFDSDGRYLKSFGTCYTNPELTGDGKKKPRKQKSVTAGKEAKKSR